jgi:hypothetical protein
MSLYFDRDGFPISGEQWGSLHNDFKYKIVMQDEVGGWLISTVWLGLDHGFDKTSAPTISRQ